jgi:hypothetical protein
MARMFNSNKVRSFFQKRKQILVDGCCEVTEPCCPNVVLGRYKVNFEDGTTPVGITDGLSFYKTLPNGTKWSFYLETIGPVDVDIINILVTPPVLNTVVNTPGTAVYPPGMGFYPIIQSGTGFAGGNFTVTIVTDSGNFTFTANIIMI